MYEKSLLTDSAQQTATLFGNFDQNITVIEKAFDVRVKLAKAFDGGNNAV